MNNKLSECKNNNENKRKSTRPGKKEGKKKKNYLSTQGLVSNEPKPKTHSALGKKKKKGEV